MVSVDVLMLIFGSLGLVDGDNFVFVDNIIFLGEMMFFVIGVVVDFFWLIEGVDVVCVLGGLVDLVVLVLVEFVFVVRVVE